MSPSRGVQLLVRTQTPADAVGEMVLVHGLERIESSQAMRAARLLPRLEAGYVVHRYNMRGCGGSPWHPKANYHSGQTGDLLHVARERKRASGLPLYAVEAIRWAATLC